MRFESVSAYAFGPFEHQTLTLSAGMNVIYGPNEAGKSTWHAALYAGLCGVRRARGQPRREDRDFEVRHRPWDRDGWEVGAVVRLADGRRVQLRHDLAGRVDSSARDLDFPARDYSSEVMNDGAPDGSRWLGLDRRSFLSTACVRQASILALLDDAATLQDELQRAADTAGVDETAAEALQRLRDFHGEHVGSDRAYTKPLQASHDRVRRARRGLDEAHRQHEDYARRQEGVDRLEAALRERGAELDAVTAVIAEAEASRLDRQLSRARELRARFPQGAPRRAFEDDRLSNEVAAALLAWNTRVEPRAPAGPTVAELEEQRRRLDERQATSGVHNAPPEQPRTRARGVAFAATGSLLAGGVLALAGVTLPGVALLAASVALFAWWLLGGSRPEAAPDDARAGTEAIEAQRAYVEHLIDDRRAADRAHQGALDAHARAVDALGRAATAAGIQADGADAQIDALLAWQDRRAAALAEDDRQREDWEELQRLLGERTVEDLAAEAAERRSEAATLAQRVSPDALRRARRQEPSEARRDELHRSMAAARDEWNTARGQLEHIAQELPSVPEAEEALAEAEAEAYRVEQLSRTLQTTIGYLEAAEERVHRDIAPVIRASVLEWLPRVTGGRYTDCLVDPQSLEVSVSSTNGRWRPAALLSHGTAEQLYLLLRLALARHLTRPEEVCPLILDDAVAACDVHRKREVLETLLAISESVQVILFTHEEDVRDWARERLGAERDCLLELDRVPAT